MKSNLIDPENISSFSFYDNELNLLNRNIFSFDDYPKPYLFESLDNINILDIEQENSYQNIQKSSPLNQFEIPETLIEKKTTAIATNINTSPLYFSFEKIKNKLKELNDSSFNIYIDILEKFKENPELKEMEDEMNLLKKKRKKYGEKVESKNDNSKYEKGRKKREDLPERKHNKKSADNIIKKIKGIILEYLLVFVNEIINNKNKLKSLDYKKNVDKIKKDEDLKLLETSVKDYLSQDISSKYFKTPIDWNKELINSILNEQKDSEVINFVFNMKIKDWIELFTLKKSIYDFESLSNIGCKEIENKLQKIQSIRKVFDEILKKNEDDFYFTKLVFYLFNYERWFKNKRGRNRKKKI